jgi:hypothetical protein
VSDVDVVCGVAQYYDVSSLSLNIFVLAETSSLLAWLLLSTPAVEDRFVLEDENPHRRGFDIIAC